MLRASLLAVLIIAGTAGCQAIWGVGETTLVSADAPASPADAPPGIDGVVASDAPPADAVVVDGAPTADAAVVDGAPTADAACTPTSCGALDAGCGSVWDHCGARLLCGNCGATSTCVDNVCQPCLTVDSTTVDIPTATISLKVSMDTLPLTDRTAHGFGTLTLRNIDTNDTIIMGATDSTHQHTVAKGVYDLYYAFGGVGTGEVTVPTNTGALIAASLRVSHDGAIPIDMHTVVIDRSVAVNGTPVPNTVVNGRGVLSLRGHRSVGDEVQFGGTDETDHHMVRVVAGTYDVFYSNSQAGSGAGNAPVVPFNDATVAVVALFAPGSIHIDIPVVSVKLAVTVNGMAIPSRDANGVGVISLRDANDNYLTWASTDSLDGSFPIVAGVYKVFYVFSAAATGGAGTPAVPINALTQIATLTFDQSKLYAIDIPVVNVSRMVTVNGQPVTDTVASGVGDLYLGSAAVHETVPLGATNANNATLAVIVGTYNIYYRHVSDGTGANGAQVVPLNFDARLAANVLIDSTRTLTIDIPTVTVDRSVTLNGQPITDSGAATLTLTDAAGRVDWGTTANVSHPVVVVPGSYTVVYQRTDFATGSFLPINVGAVLPTSVTLQASGTTTIDLRPGQATIGVTVAGSSVPDQTESGFGYLTLENVAGDAAQLGDTYALPSMLPVLPDTYDLFYALNDLGTGLATVVKVPENLHRKLGCVMIH